MPLVTSATLEPSYDVIIVGSGAGGGQSAYCLTLEGAKVLLLEAGRNYVPRDETPMFQTGRNAPLRGANTPDKPFGFYDATIDGGWQVPGEPYHSASDDPRREFWWWRSRMLGGRTNHWGRYSFRNGPYDFKPRSRDGLGFDWPISYDDLAPYYDKVEMLIGVYGESNGLENTPDSPAGCLLPPPKPLVGELLLRKHGGRLGIPVIAARRAVLTERQESERIAAALHPGNPFAQRLARESMDGRAACFWATGCGRGCSIRATYQSTTVHLPPAEASGNLHVLTNAMAREVSVGPDGRATGVHYVDKTTGRDGHARGRIVILAASACETVRLLLNSRSPAHPQGLANSSGLVGKYLMDTVGTSLRAQIPMMENMPLHNEDGAASGHTYAPWWLYKEQLAGRLGFARGYHIEFSCGRKMPGVETLSGLEWLTGGSYGTRFKADARRYYGSFIGLHGRGEMIPNEHCYCEVDPVARDRWGIPVLRFHWQWSEHETRQAEHMRRTFADVFAALGGRLTEPLVTDGPTVIQKGGSVIHEVGGALMGEDPAKSVTNGWCQTHDVKNLFLTDGAPFASNADKNPTLTIMALAWRACDRITAMRKRGEL